MSLTLGAPPPLVISPKSVGRGGSKPASRRLGILPLVLFAAGAWASPGGADLAAFQVAALPTDPWNRAAMDWLELLRAGRFDEAAARVDPAVPPGALGAEQLRTIWGQLTAQVGGLVRLETGQVTPSGGYHLVDLPAAFEKQNLTVRVVLTDSLRVSGLFFRPPAPPAYEPPPYVDTTRFREVEVEVGKEPWLLPGTLSVPAGAGPFPGLVLVHGSGPNDRDETIGGNRPFRDLAWGLASGGVAVLRYDKRTRVYGGKLPPDLGLEAEVVEDALAALDLLRHRPEVDPDRVFLLGHSLGGMLAPDIALRDGKVAGVVVLAAPLRPFTAVLRSQLEYVASLARAGDSAGVAEIRSLLDEVGRLERGEIGPEEKILGVGVAYWQEVARVDPLAAALRFPGRLLVLQGGRDYQSTEEDFQLWRRGLEGKAGADFRWYPSLNHLFAPGEGTAKPEEYTQGVGHVDPQVIQDLLDWLLHRG